MRMDILSENENMLPKLPFDDRLLFIKALIR